MEAEYARRNSVIPGRGTGIPATGQYTHWNTGKCGMGWGKHIDINRKKEEVQGQAIIILGGPKSY